MTSRLAASGLNQHEHDRANEWLNAGEGVFWPFGKNADSAWMLARIARREGDLQAMDRHLSTALTRGLDQERVERERILARVQSGELQTYEAKINEWLMQSDPDSAEICDAYANGLAVVSRLDDAVRVLDAWHADDPSHPVPLYRLGKIHEYFDDTDAATASYQQAIAANPNYYPATFRLANLYLDSKLPRKAYDLFGQCSIESCLLASQVGMGQSLVGMGKYDQARELLQVVLQHDYEQIKSSYQSLNENPETFIAASELGKLEVNEGNFSEGLRWLEMALDKNPRDLSARYSMAVALRQLGREEDAEKHFEQVAETKRSLEQVNVLRNQIGRNPTDADSRVELGKILLKYESERNGLFWLNSALTVDPEHREAHATLANFYASKSQLSAEYKSLAEHHSRLSKLRLPNKGSGEQGKDP